MASTLAKSESCAASVDSPRAVRSKPRPERMARLTQPDLPESGVRYTRAVTQIWCGFFVLNAALSSWTIYLDNLRVWTLYNGLISYLLMGSLFVGEWLYRPHYRKRFESEAR